MNDIIKNVLDMINDPDEESIQRIIHTIMMIDEPNSNIVITACMTCILSIVYEKKDPLDEIHSICDDLIACTEKAVVSGHCAEVKRKRKELGLDEVA